MINMPITDIKMTISSDVEKSETGAGVGESPDVSFLDVLAVDTPLPETAVDDQLIAPLAARTLGQVLQPSKRSEAFAMRNISLSGGLNGQADAAQDTSQHPLNVPVDQTQAYSSVPDLPLITESEASVAVRTGQTEDAIERHTHPSTLSDAKDAAESPAIKLTKRQTLIFQNRVAKLENIAESEPSTLTRTKLAVPDAIKTDAPEVSPVLQRPLTDQQLQTKPEPKIAQHAASIETSVNSFDAADTTSLLSRRLNTGVDVIKLADQEAATSVQNRSIPAPIDKVPIAHPNKVIAPKIEDEKGKQHQFSDAPIAAAKKPALPVVGASSAVAPAMLTYAAPHALGTDTDIANVASPLSETPLAKTTKINTVKVKDTRSTSSVEASALNKPDHPQPLEGTVMSSRNPMRVGAAGNQSLPNKPEPPQSTSLPIAPAAPEISVRQPFLQTEVVHSHVSFQSKAETPISSENVRAEIPVVHPPATVSASQHSAPLDAPTLPVLATETGLLSQIEPLETPDLFPIETRHVESAGIRSETITARPEVARQVAQQLADVARQMPDRPIELSLNPEELGRVRLTFTMSDGGISVAVIAERGETVDLMRRHIETLAQEFRDMGYRDVNFEFSRNGRDDTGAGAKNRDSSANSDNPSSEPETLAPVQLSLEPTTGLDLRL